MAAIAMHEARDAIRHIVSNTPWAHFVHQSNLAEERVLYFVLDRVLTHYRSLFAPNADVVNASLSELGLELQHQTEWSAAHSSVSAYVEDAELRLERVGDSDVNTPVTLPEAVDITGADESDIAAYGGTLIGWCDVADAGQRFRLPESVAYRTR